MDRNREIAEKRRRLREFLAREGLGAAVFSTQALYSWYTGGGDGRVAIGTDAASAHIVATGEQGSRDVVVTTNIEAPRLESEDLAGTVDFDLRAVPWHEEEALAAAVASLLSGRRAASDTGAFGLPRLPGSFQELTYVLTERERERYRALGADCSEALEGALSGLPRGSTEQEVASRLGRELLARGVLPQVILVAADERARLFRHPLPTSLRARGHIVASICGKRGGLVASATRVVSFGQPDAELRRRHDAVVRVDAALIRATAAGRCVGDVFAEGVRAYEEAGFPGEWRLHHQGGATGYQGRSYRAHARSRQTVLDGQAFAWNPSIAGTKSEDTILVNGSGQEVLTACRRWPAIHVDGLARADVLAL